MSVSTILPEVLLVGEDQLKMLDPNKFANVYLVRHQETLENKTKAWSGNRINSHLTEEGAKKAAIEAPELLKRIGSVQAIYASETFRAVESALPLAELCLCPCLSIQNFHESNHGVLSGKTPEERKAIKSQDPYYAKRKEVTRIQKFYVYPVAPDAELAFHAAQRVTKALTGVAKKHLGETVVIFGHGGPMQKLKYLHFIQQFEKQAIHETDIPEEIDHPNHGEAWHLMVSDRQIYILV